MLEWGKHGWEARLALSTLAPASSLSFPVKGNAVGAAEMSQSAKCLPCRMGPELYCQHFCGRGAHVYDSSAKEEEIPGGCWPAYPT